MSYSLCSLYAPYNPYSSPLYNPLYNEHNVGLFWAWVLLRSVLTPQNDPHFYVGESSDYWEVSFFGSFRGSGSWHYSDSFGVPRWQSVHRAASEAAEYLDRELARSVIHFGLRGNGLNPKHLNTKLLINSGGFEGLKNQSFPTKMSDTPLTQQ